MTGPRGPRKGTAKSDPKVLRRIAREALDRINTLPEAQGRRVVRFLGLLYLRPADCREIERILTIDAKERLVLRRDPLRRRLS